jgi:hypothetical protein
MILGTLPAPFMKLINDVGPRVELSFTFSNGDTIPAQNTFGKSLATFPKEINYPCHKTSLSTAPKGMGCVFPKLKILYIIVLIRSVNMKILYFIPAGFTIKFWDILFFPRP